MPLFFEPSFFRGFQGTDPIFNPQSLDAYLHAYSQIFPPRQKIKTQMLDAPTYFFGAPPELLGLTTPATIFV